MKADGESPEELTLEEAADLLGLSAEGLRQLIAEGEVVAPSGGELRLNAREVLQYRAERESRRQTNLRELTRLSEEFEDD